jgi:hypothetical protein
MDGQDSGGQGNEQDDEASVRMRRPCRFDRSSISRAARYI